MSNIVVLTTFPNNMYEVYARDMVTSFVKHWPAEIPLLVQLDDQLLEEQVKKLMRPTDAVAVGWEKSHLEFVQRNKDKDTPQDYRGQVTRFCHKVFAIKRALDAIRKAPESEKPRYLIWMDADVITSRQVSMEEIKGCLPKEGDALSYLGRKDWPHSECGWVAFDLTKEGDIFIDVWHGLYVSDEVLRLKEQHDSWAFDMVKNAKEAPPCTNLTDGKPGMDIWQHSPMSNWSIHKKGPVAKQMIREAPKNSNFVVQTKNAIPHDQICKHIEENQKLIKNWVSEGIKTDEQIIIASAGPQLIPELDLMEDYKKGVKIIAVKHALNRLKDAGIKPWACILLDPRPHVYNFVDNPDRDVLWFVASQVDPRVVVKLLAYGCKVYGYHASVGAGETDLIMKQPDAIISGGSATATRGMFMLRKLGFHRFKLYGYELCYPDKPDMAAKDDYGQPKYFELSIGWNDPLANHKKCFWTEAQLMAQFEELNQIIQNNVFELEAYGDGIIPFILKAKRAGELRRAKISFKMKPKHYSKIIKWPKKNFLTRLLKA